jgi:hypothetical protein
MPEDPNTSEAFTVDDGEYFDFDLNQEGVEEVDDEL